PQRFQTPGWTNYSRERIGCLFAYGKHSCECFSYSEISKAPPNNAAVGVMFTLAALRFDAVLSVKVVHGV
ncbi:MAG: hypothetical protein WA214_17370, partial [Pseudolabrys sp.]